MNEKKRTKEEIAKIQETMRDVSEKLTGIPHILIGTSLIEGTEDKGWLFSACEASSSDVLNMLTQFMRTSKAVFAICERALEDAKEQGIKDDKSIDRPSDESTGDISLGNDSDIEGILKRMFNDENQKGD